MKRYRILIQGEEYSSFKDVFELVAGINPLTIDIIIADIHQTVGQYLEHEIKNPKEGVEL